MWSVRLLAAIPVSVAVFLGFNRWRAGVLMRYMVRYMGLGRPFVCRHCMLPVPYGTELPGEYTCPSCGTWHIC